MKSDGGEEREGKEKGVLSSCHARHGTTFAMVHCFECKRYILLYRVLQI
jgi:hypothetical protein